MLVGGSKDGGDGGDGGDDDNVEEKEADDVLLQTTVVVRGIGGADAGGAKVSSRVGSR